MRQDVLHLANVKTDTSESLDLYKILHILQLQADTQDSHTFIGGQGPLLWSIK